MKVKVKGLVFVGFAAMIFAANAMAADNTVTSKSYVDTKFQTIENIETAYTAANKNSTTEYPAMSALTQALTENGGVVNDSTVSVTQNGATIGSFSTNQSSGSTLAIAGADWNAESGTAGYINNKPTVDTTFDATSGNAATSAAIADYVGTQLTSNQADWAETTTTDPSYIQNKPTQLSQFQDNIDAANAIDSITVGGTAVTPDSNKAVALGAAAGKGVDTDFTDTTSTDVPTTAAVADYVGTQLTSNQADWAETVTTDPSYINNKPTQLSQFQDNIDAANVLNGVKVNGTALNIDTTDKTVNLGAAAGAGLASGITSSETGLTSGQQVYNYIDSLPAADIPAMPTQAEDPDGYCDASHPCALVTDETSGKPVWKRIAQQGD